MALIAFSLGIVPSAQAGLYNTADAPEETRFSRDFAHVFNGVLGDLRSVGAPNPERESTLRKRYMLMETLGNKGVFDLRTLEQILNFSVVLIRRNRADEAIVLLTPLTREHPNNLIVYSHFATAHFLSANKADRDRAPGLMKDCLDIWPERWEDLEKDRQTALEKLGWGSGMFEQNRKCEAYLHKLMQLRKKAKPGEVAIDPLFGPKDKPVRFVNDAGKYEAGHIPIAEKDKLPGDALEIVEQLLVWMPNDLQLYWLLGEIFNASAMSKKTPQEKYQDIKAAYLILKEIKTGMRQKDVPKELDDHFEKLDEYIKKTPAPNPISPDLDKLVKDVNKEEDENKLTPEQYWRAVIVAFLTGLAIGLFTLWQFQEMRRRRQARA
jgi:hypothetical protein